MGDTVPATRPPTDVFDHSVLMASTNITSHDIVYEPHGGPINLHMSGEADPFIGDNPSKTACIWQLFY